MGNRVVIQFKNGAEVSPAIYGHWFGSEAAQLLVKLRQQMADRPGDLPYVAARCIARMPDGDLDSTGFGIWNAPKALTAEDSHGDAGVYLVDISGPRWRVAMLGGRASERGDIPKAKAEIIFTSNPKGAY